MALLRPITPATLTADARPGQASQAIDFQYETTWYLALASSQLPGRVAQDSTLLLLRKLEASGNGEWAAKAKEVLGELGD